MADGIRSRLHAVPGLTSLARRWQRRRHERSVARFLAARDGLADRLPRGIVYEATMRCNLRCAFCYVANLLNIEGEWRSEMSAEALDRAFPERPGIEVSLTGGEILVRKDIGDVLDVFRRKGYVCRYLTTNGTLIDDARAEALARLVSAGFLRHVSVSIDGPGGFHDAARGVAGAFERTAAGLRRLRRAAEQVRAPLRVSITTTISGESLPTLDQMVEVAEQLEIDAIGVNHLMFATPGEITQTADALGVADQSVIATYAAADPGVPPSEVRTRLDRLMQQCRLRGLRFDFRPKVREHVIDRYYTPGTPLAGRCLYPFLHARIGYSGKVYFCPFIRIEVGDLSQSSLEQIWNGATYVQLRRRLLEHGLFPVCRRCCKVELERTC